MGINGLLPVVKPICEPSSIEAFAHTRVGVDVYGWLHKGAFSCALDLCRGIDTARYVEFCMHRVRMLIHFKVTPVMVFDGADLPMKAGTHHERRERRQDALRKAEHQHALGNRRKAEEWYQRAYTVTSEMARSVIRECRKINVEYVVAPYEADAQLAWMIKTGYIDGVVTEDSDMLVYGASKVFFKMNRYGKGDLFQKKNLPSLDTLNMNNFTEDMFMYMCVCSGCDFFKGVQGLGVKKAYTLVKKFRTMARLIFGIRQDRRYPVPKSFSQDFSRACLVFRHQSVFDVQNANHIHLNEFDEEARLKLPEGVLSKNTDGSVDLSFLGAHRDKSIAARIAIGLVHPRTLEEYAEPLDLISRPLSQTPSNKTRSGIRHPAVRSRPPSNLNHSGRGFQVQPATDRSERSYLASKNLRQRLSGRRSMAIAFNPRRIGASFRSKIDGSSMNSGIWAGFKKGGEVTETASLAPAPSVEAHDVNLAEENKETGAQQPVNPEENITFAQQNVTEVHPENHPTRNDVADSGQENANPLELRLSSNSEKRTDDMPSPVARTTTKEPAGSQDTGSPQNCDPYQSPSDQAPPQTLENVSSGKRQRTGSSHRVEAVNRAVNKFAQSEKKDKMLKFLSAPTGISGSELHTQRRDTDQAKSLVKADARPVDTVQASRGPAKKKRRFSLPRQEAGSQLRVSRFFHPKIDPKNITDDKSNQRDDRQAPSSTEPVGEGIGRSVSSTCSKPIRKRKTITSLDRLKRGAAGKTAVRQLKNR